MKLKLSYELCNTSFVKGSWIHKFCRLLHNNWNIMPKSVKVIAENVDNYDSNEFYSVKPVCRGLYDTYDAGSGLNAQTRYSINDYMVTHLNQRNIKPLGNRLKGVSFYDILCWLKFLLNVNFKNDNQYLVALVNLSIIINSELPFGKVIGALRIFDKSDMLHTLQKLQTKYLNDSNSTDFEKISKIFNETIASNQKYYLDSDKLLNVSNSSKNIHKIIRQAISNIRKYVLDHEIKQSKPKVCPYCKHLTFTKFKFCQYCGKQLN